MNKMGRQYMRLKSEPTLSAIYDLAIALSATTSAFTRDSTVVPPPREP